MKLLSTLTIATLLTAGSAFAATATPTATPATNAAPAHKHSSSMHCQREAKAKKLTGDEAAKFVKECKEGKKD
jgi:Spy/CpxP family protein refolding chaperone